ncbi:hypothetical protein E2P64_03565 [Candidatus Bathyarchaeota archaeon]|jgi:hypothetical protein|nr:hypothetical protein E2P64_03565 [Candidatus Bathyarchaeota archaeon]
MTYNPYYPYGYPSHNPLSNFNPYSMQLPYYPPQPGYSYSYPSPWTGVQSYENPQSAPTPQSIYPFTLQQQQQPTYPYYPNMQPYYYPGMTTSYYPYGQQQQLLPSY